MLDVNWRYNDVLQLSNDLADREPIYLCVIQIKHVYSSISYQQAFY